MYLLMLNLYEVATECGLSREVVFHDRENTHGFVKTMGSNW